VTGDRGHEGGSGDVAVGGGLFQIAEPGESRGRGACQRAVGIDLGTTNSLVAVIENGAARAIAGDDGSALLPSVVSYGRDGSVVVGEPARRAAAERPRDTISSVKRLMGRAARDVAGIAEMVPYEVVEPVPPPSRAAPTRGANEDFGGPFGGPAGRPSAELGGGTSNAADGARSSSRDRSAGARGTVAVKLTSGRDVAPVEVSAEILRALVARAMAATGESISAAVITVPAYFDDGQRQATRDAGRLAGLEVLRLLAEPTAAALAYGLDQGSRGRFAVYDLGGGTFDISILELHQGIFKVVATGGDTALGGDDVDRALAGRLLSAAGLAPSDPAVLRAALDEARAAKHALTDAEATEMRLGDVAVRLARAELAETMRPLLDKTGRAVKRALRDAEIAADELDGVILVGGSTKSPVVREFVAELFGRQPLCQLDPEEVVALGAAAQAHALSGGDSDVVLLDVIPLSLGIETMGGVVEKLVTRNSTIPVRSVQTFTTYADNQTGFDIHVVQGERETVEGNRSLARFQLKGLPPMPAGLARVEICFEVDADGLTGVSAHELTTGIEGAVEVVPTYGLTDEEVERMLLDSFAHAEADLVRRNLLGERVEAARIAAATRAALASDGELCDPASRAAIGEELAALEQAAAGDDHQLIRRRIEALDRVSHPFAEARMNRAVRQAVAGRSVDEVASEVDSGPSERHRAAGEGGR